MHKPYYDQIIPSYSPLWIVCTIWKIQQCFVHHSLHDSLCIRRIVILKRISTKLQFYLNKELKRKKKLFAGKIFKHLKTISMRSYDQLCHYFKNAIYSGFYLFCMLLSFAIVILLTHSKILFWLSHSLKSLLITIVFRR